MVSSQSLVEPGLPVVLFFFFSYVFTAVFIVTVICNSYLFIYGALRSS